MNFNIEDSSKCPSDKGLPSASPYALLNLPIPSLGYSPQTLLRPSHGLPDGSPKTTQSSGTIPLTSPIDPNSEYLELLASLIRGQRLQDQHPGIWAGHHLDDGSNGLPFLRTTPLMPHAYPAQLVLTPGTSIPTSLPSLGDKNVSENERKPHGKSNDDTIDVCGVKDRIEHGYPRTLLDTSVAAVYSDNESDHEVALGNTLPLGADCARTVPNLMKCYSRHKRPLTNSLSVSLSVSGQATPPSSPISPGTFPRAPPATPECSPQLKTSQDMEFPTKFSIPQFSTTKSMQRTIETPPVTPKGFLKAPLGNCVTSKPSTPNTSSPKGYKTNTSTTTARGQLLSSPSCVTTRPDPFTSGWPLPPQPDLSSSTPMWIPQGVDHTMNAGLGLGYQFARDPLTGHIVLLPRTHPITAAGNGSIMWAGFGGLPPPPMMMTPQQLLLGDPHFRTSLQQYLSQPVPSSGDSLEQSCKKELNSNIMGTERIPPSLSSSVPPHYLYPPSSSLPYFFPQAPPHRFPLSTYSTQLPTPSFNLDAMIPTQTTSTPSTFTETVSVTSNHHLKKVPLSPPARIPSPDAPIDLTKKSNDKSLNPPVLKCPSSKSVVIKKEIKEELISPVRVITEIASMKKEPVFLTETDEPVEPTPEIPVSEENSFDPGRSHSSSTLTGLELLSQSILQHVGETVPPSPESDRNSCDSDTMPKLERIVLSPSPRRSPSSCEPPILTPLDRTPVPSPVTEDEVVNKGVSGLSILCALAEQELEVAHNCSALTSLAEVAAAHQNIEDQVTSRKRTWSDASMDTVSPKITRFDHHKKIEMKEDINQNYQSMSMDDQFNDLNDQYNYSAPVYELPTSTYETSLSENPKDNPMDSDGDLDNVWSADPEEQHSFNGFSDGSLIQEESDTESKDALADSRIFITETSVDSPASDIESLSSSKKRKPGRPKKHSPIVRGNSDESLICRQNSLDFMMVSHKPKIRPMLRAEIKIKDSDNEQDASDKEMCDQDDIQKSLNNNVPSKVSRKTKVSRQRSLTRKAILQDKEKRKSSLANQSQMEALYRSLKRHSKVAAPEHDESDDERDMSLVKVKEETSESVPEVESEKNENSPESMEIEKCEVSVDKAEVSACTLLVEDLVANARVLVLQDGLLYAGSLMPITPPDVYGVHIDGERRTRPNIYCQEELLMQAWKEVKPGSTRFLTEGTRVCAFWSQQYRGLYPGTVAVASSPLHEGVHNFVSVEFDDGDSGRIHVDDIRLLPADFPFLDYDPNPLLTLNKRKRRTEDNSSEKYPDGYLKKTPPGNPLKLIITKDVSRKIEDTKSNMDDQQLETPKKKHKKNKHESKHKHRHKHRKSETPYMIEPGDSELRVRIRSPTHVNCERNVEFREEKKSDIKETQVTASEAADQKPLNERKKKRNPSEKSRIAPFLPDRQLWKWSGKGFKRPGAKGKGKKEFYKEIVRGKEHIRVGDCAVFLSTGRPDRPYIGKIEFLWESWGGNMVVKVKWFYHPDETKGLNMKLAEPKGALFQSPHTDENDVQTVSRRCNVVPLSEYKLKRAAIEKEKGPDYDNHDLYYLAGSYDPYVGKITMEPGVS